MEDVIFNGSSTRKPGGRASVELVFDNSLGRIGGQWARTRNLGQTRADATAIPIISSTASMCGAGTSPICSWARGWVRASTRSSSRHDFARDHVQARRASCVSGGSGGCIEISRTPQGNRGSAGGFEGNLNRVSTFFPNSTSRLKTHRLAAVAAKYHEFNNELKLNENLWAFTRQREMTASRNRYANEIVKAETGVESEISSCAKPKWRWTSCVRTITSKPINSPLRRRDVRIEHRRDAVGTGNQFPGREQKRLSAQLEGVVQQLAEIELNREATSNELERWHHESASGIDKVASARANGYTVRRRYRRSRKGQSRDGRNARSGKQKCAMPKLGRRRYGRR